MSPEPGSLNPQQRRRDLERMSEGELDVLVIGGGVTGVGCALDAATAASPSVLSSSATSPPAPPVVPRLMHGGLRYLEQMDFAAGARGAPRARSAHHLDRAAPRAPDLSHPAPRSIWQRAYYGAGVLSMTSWRSPVARSFPAIAT